MEQNDISVRLERALMSLCTPGIKLERVPGVPLFWASERDGFIVREIDGVTDEGRYISGQGFVPEKNL